MARDFLSMAIEKIRVARTKESIGTQDGKVYARNKALQSAGMGVELVYKAMILGHPRLRPPCPPRRAARPHLGDGGRGRPSAVAVADEFVE